MKVDGRYEGQAGLPRRRWSVTKSVCISFFSLYVREYVRAYVSWQSHSCRVGQKMRDGLQPPSPVLAVGRNLQAVCSFLMVGETTAGQRQQDA